MPAMFCDAIVTMNSGSAMPTMAAGSKTGETSCSDGRR